MTSTTITGVYDSLPEAVAAVSDLQAANICDARIRLVARNIGTAFEEASVAADVGDDQLETVRAIIGEHETLETLVTGREGNLPVVPLLS